jgi:hypothetical protein
MLPGITSELRLRSDAGYSAPSAIAAGRTGATIGATEAWDGDEAKNAALGDGIAAREEGGGAGAVYAGTGGRIAAAYADGPAAVGGAAGALGTGAAETTPDVSMYGTGCGSVLAMLWWERGGGGIIGGRNAPDPDDDIACEPDP